MPGFKHNERFTYDRLKKEALDALYNYSRDLGVREGRPHIEVVGMVSYCYDDGFERPIEDLMWNCILYVISGGWYQKPKEIIKCEIEKYLETYGIDEMTADIPADEADSIKFDLKILGFI